MADQPKHSTLSVAANTLSVCPQSLTGHTVRLVAYVLFSTVACDMTAFALHKFRRQGERRRVDILGCLRSSQAVQERTTRNVRGMFDNDSCGMMCAGILQGGASTQSMCALSSTLLLWNVVLKGAVFTVSVIFLLPCPYPFVPSGKVVWNLFESSWCVFFMRVGVHLETVPVQRLIRLVFQLFSWLGCSVVVDWFIDWLVSISD